MSDVVRPLNHPRLRAYLNDIVDWHGYIRFLGLPTFQDKTDVGIGELFVAPALSAQRVSPDSDPRTWPATESVLDALQRERRIVLLGDPGSGKSTLINWLAWRLAAGLSDRLPDWIDAALPLPLVLRELELGTLRNFDDLLDAFLKRPVAQALSKDDLLHTYLARGRVLLLLDGIDEVSLETRRQLRAAVWDGWQRYPGLYCLATSRLVGYDECMFDVETMISADGAAGGPTEEVPNPARLIAPMQADFAQRRRSALAYVVPFDDPRIEAFVANWYRARIASPREAQAEAGNLLGALRRGDGTWRLARTPNLLTIMALVYRVRVKLPDGRGLLYDSIAQAYLESIDQSRGFEGPYPWQEKRRWLARVGFEMQHRRGQHQDADDDEALLASETKVLGWIRSAMKHSSYESNDDFARDYLQWIARRSGLLLPRGDARYAFLHLSFQEYFAAVYLLDQIQGPDWAALPKEGAKRAPPGLDGRITQNRLGQWAAESGWRETLIFAFELLGQEPRWADKLATWIFGSGLARAAPIKQLSERRNQAVLLARLLVNPHSGLSAALRDKAWERCWAHLRAAGVVSSVRPSETHSYSATLLQILHGAESIRPRLFEAVAQADPRHLDLKDTNIADLNPWVDAAPNLRTLHAWGSPIADLAPLLRLQHLEALSLSAAAATDLSLVSELPRLTSLGLYQFESGQAIDWLGRCSRLQSLSLWDYPGDPVSLIGNLSALTYLTLGCKRASSLEPLSRLKALRHLILGVSDSDLDLTPLMDLPHLERLYLDSTKVRNLERLRRKPGLKVLVFGNAARAA